MKTDILTRNDLSRMLGDLDDGIVADLLAIGATLPELWTAIQLVDHEWQIPDRRAEAARVCSVLRHLHTAPVELEPEYSATD